MKILLKFGIVADFSTFGLPCFATPRYEMGGFKMGKIKTDLQRTLATVRRGMRGAESWRVSLGQR